LSGYMGSRPITIMRKSTTKVFHEIDDFNVVITPGVTCDASSTTNCVRSIAEINLAFRGHTLDFGASAVGFQYDGEHFTTSYDDPINDIRVDVVSKTFTVTTGDRLLLSVTVTFNSAYMTVELRLANSTAYNGRISGMAGNFNFDPTDDFQTADGKVSASTGEIGDSYIPENFGLYSSTSCLPSSLVEKDLVMYEWAAKTPCRFLSDQMGPFNLCYKYFPREQIFQAYVKCLDTATSYYNQQDTADHNVCEGPLLHFANRCKDVAINFDVNTVTTWKWRRDTGCIKDCRTATANSMYCSMHPRCQNSCNYTCASQFCPNDDRIEGCFCYYDSDVRYVRQGDELSPCVKLTECDSSGDQDRCKGVHDDFKLLANYPAVPGNDNVDDSCDRTQKPSD